MTKLICIKNCEAIYIPHYYLGGSKATIYKIYYSNTYYIVNSLIRLYDKYDMYLGSFERINFLLINEYREQQINKILND